MSYPIYSFSFSTSGFDIWIRHSKSHLEIAYYFDTFCLVVKALLRQVADLFLKGLRVDLGGV